MKFKKFTVLVASIAALSGVSAFGADAKILIGKCKGGHKFGINAKSEDEAKQGLAEMCGSLEAVEKVGELKNRSLNDALASKGKPSLEEKRAQDAAKPLGLTYTAANGEKKFISQEEMSGSKPAGSSIEVSASAQ